MAGFNYRLNTIRIWVLPKCKRGQSAQNEIILTGYGRIDTDILIKKSNSGLFVYHLPIDIKYPQSEPSP
ncbi:hypothetical protein D3C85_1654930 [compost metagenome]